MKKIGLLQSVADITSFYDAKAPTSRKVVKCIETGIVSDAQRAVLSYLQRFIRSLVHKDLRLFFIFVTGTE